MLITGRGGWQAIAEVAASPLSRGRGLMARSPTPLLLRCSSVHGFWLRAPLHVVGIAADGTVVAVALLRRRRIMRMASCRWMLELPLGHPLPEPGERLTFHP